MAMSLSDIKKRPVAVRKKDGKPAASKKDAIMPFQDADAKTPPNSADPSLLKNNEGPTPDMGILSTDDSRASSFTSAKDLTQIQHRPDTKIDDSIIIETLTSAEIKPEVVVVTSERSDTNISDTNFSSAESSDTKRSDTVPSKEKRPDTNKDNGVWETSLITNDLSKNGKIPSQERSDTDPTQSESIRFVPRKDNRNVDNSQFDPTQTRHRSDTDSDTSPDTKKQSNDDVKETVQKLRGNLLKLFYYICDEILHQNELLIHITYAELAYEADVPQGSVITSVKRLSNEKNLIILHRSKSGGAGAKVKLEVTPVIINLFSRLRTQLDKNLLRTYRSDTTSDTNSDTNSSRKKDIFVNSPWDKENSKETTLSISSIGYYTHLDFSNMPKGFNPELVNRALIVKAVKHLKQEQFQDFIDRFPHYVATRAEPVESMVGYFYRKLSTYLDDGFSDVLKSKTQKELNDEYEWALSVKKMKEQQDLINMARELQAKADEQKLYQQKEEEFELWYRTASDEDKKSLVAPNSFNSLTVEIYKAALFGAFMDK